MLIIFFLFLENLIKINVILDDVRKYVVIIFLLTEVNELVTEVRNFG